MADSHLEFITKEQLNFLFLNSTLLWEKKWSIILTTYQKSIIWSVQKEALHRVFFSKNCIQFNSTKVLKPFLDNLVSRITLGLRLLFLYFFPGATFLIKKGDKNLSNCSYLLLCFGVEIYIQWATSTGSVIANWIFWISSDR